MSAMLSSLINLNAKYTSKRKRKQNTNLNLPIRRIQSPSSPASFMSPELVDTNEKVFAPMGRTHSTQLQDEEVSYHSYESKYDEENPILRSNPPTSPQLRLDIPSSPLTDWLTHDPLKSGAQEAWGRSFEKLNESGSLIGSGRGTLGARSSRSREAFGPSAGEAAIQADETTKIDVANAEELDRQSMRKPAPAPIRIPNAAIHGPKVQLQRSAHMDTQDVTTTIPSTTQSCPNSPLSAAENMSSENMSAVSGTTLARALFANSFVLSNDARASRHRSGLSVGGTRLDSATLPRGEPFFNSPFWHDKRISGGDIILSPESGRHSFVPPVPRMPSVSSLRAKGSSARSSTAASENREKGRHQSGAGLSRRTSSSSLRSPRLSGSEHNPPLVRSSSLTGVATPERRISRIVEVPSPAPSASDTPIRGVKSANDGSSSAQGSSPLVNMNYRSEKSPLSEYDISTPSLDPRDNSPHLYSHSDTSPSPKSGQSMSIANVLDDYVLVSFKASGQSALSPMAPESSASITAPVPYRTAPRRTSKKRKSSKIVFSTNSSSIANGKGRVDWRQRHESDTRQHPSPRNSSKVKRLPIGERPGSLLVPQTPLMPVSVPTSGSPLRLTPGVRVLSTPPSATSTTHFISGLETPIESPDVLDGKLAPIPRRLFARQRSGSTPNPISVIREPKDISQFDITVGPERYSSENDTPSTGSGHQTFPETPNAFSPLWSPSYAGSLNVPAMPSLSAASSQAFIPGNSPRVTSLSGILQGSQPSLAQSVLLSRATTVSGDKPATGHSKLHTVTEVTESDRSHSTLPTPELTTPSSSLNKSPSAEILSEPVDASATREKPLPAMPSIPPRTQAQNANLQPPPVRPVPRPLPNISQAPHSPALSIASSSSYSPRSASPLHAPSSPLASRRPLPDHSPSRTIFTSPHSHPASSRSISPPASVAPPPTHLPSLNAHPAPSTVQTSAPPESRRPLEEHRSSLSPSFTAPPPYQAVVNGQTDGCLPMPAVSRQGSDAGSQISHSQPSDTSQKPSTNQPSPASRSSSGRAARPRPPLPLGPRKPSAASMISPGSLAALRGRNGSISSVSSSTRNGGAGGSSNSGGWRKLVAQSSSPKFQVPAPKFRGYTLEAAQWTFTSQQLQAIVSRAIKQSAEASSVRLLRLETLDADIPGEMHRLEMQKMDLKGRYKLVARKRWTLLGSLGAHVDGLEETDGITALRALEELTEVSSMLDQLAEELHCVTEQLAHLKSLGDVHSASALAMALRKLNTSFLKQVAENQALRQHISTMEAERDEAWKQAEDVAQEFDDLIDRYGESQTPSSFKSPNSRRSSRVSAVRKSSIIVSRAGLRSASSIRRSNRSSAGSSVHRGSMAVPSSSTDEVPPVPPMPHQTALGILTADLPSRSSMAVSSATPSSDTRDMLRAQEELYDLLGISTGDIRGNFSRRRSITGPARHSRHTSIMSPYPRPVSDISTPGFQISSIPGSARLT